MAAALRTPYHRRAAPRADHAWIVDDFVCSSPLPYPISWCGACGSFGYPYINKCNASGFDLSSAMLRHTYGALAPRTPAIQAHLLTLRQRPYFPANRTGMDESAFIYVPRAFVADVSACRVHVAYHGCGVQRGVMGPNWAAHIGLLEWAEANALLVLFPQADTTVDWAACWDWTGETGAGFDTRDGLQLATVAGMLRDLQRIVSNGTEPARGAWSNRGAIVEQSWGATRATGGDSTPTDPHVPSPR